MSTIDNLRSRIAGIVSPAKNTMSLPRQFLKHGNKMMTADWTQINMKDEDFYTGYSYAAIRNRANKVKKTATENIRTVSEIEGFVHPYLEVIEDSSTFTDTQFWNDISTYMDLEGVYYLMVVRAVEGERIGNVTEFKLLNPFDVKRVIDKSTFEVAGYIESRNGQIREIPKEMIIEMRELNPFDENSSYSLTDAARESQFTLKTANDHTRHSLKHNINSPGILSTDVILPDEEFTNFTDRVKGHTKGEVVFGNGANSIKYQSMGVELSKSALKDVNEVNRDTLFSVMGVSKTTMNIEQSGTTRDTAGVQKQLSIEDHILPRITLITDALNQDYKNFYPKDFESNQAVIVVDNPLPVDHAGDKLANDVRASELELFIEMIRLGYDEDTAAGYVNGTLDIDAIGEPELPEPIIPPPEDEDEESEEPEELEEDLTEESFTLNQFEEEKAEEKQGLVQEQQGALQNAIIKAEEQLVIAAIDRLPKKIDNQLQEDDLVTATEQERVERELKTVLIEFYGVVFFLEGQNVINKRISTFTLPGQYKIDKNSNAFINKISEKTAKSHVDTVVSDVLQVARDGAKQGLSVVEIQGKITESFGTKISENRAKAIARTETNRAFTMAQFDADRQFISQNGLESRAFKRWVTRSDDPCDFCLSLEAEGEVPFDSNFRNLGDTVVVGKGDSKQVLDVNYTDLEAGNAHVNCACIYELVIRTEAENAIINEVKEAKEVLKDVRKERQEVNKEKRDFAKDVDELDDLLEGL